MLIVLRWSDVRSMYIGDKYMEKVDAPTETWGQIRHTLGFHGTVPGPSDAKTTIRDWIGWR